MDTLSSVTISSSGVAPAASTAPASAATVAGDATATAADSVRVTLSAFAQSLLAQRASSAQQALQVAAAQNPLSPSLRYAANGQLYTSAGLLQQFSLTQFLAHIGGNTDDLASADNSQLAASLGLPDPNSANSGAVLLDLMNAYQQIGVLGSLTSREITPAQTEPASIRTTEKPLVANVDTRSAEVSGTRASVAENSKAVATRSAIDVHA